MEDVLVSISCITYNHEKYIGDAIDSFLMQKTNFKYEILIHDDASTDQTAKIIREYEREYPQLIRPIYQKINQYSKGINVDLFNIERAKGKYIAICEGDDYWTDPYKLQKQVDYMESHPECSLCVHGGFVVSTEKIVKYQNRPNKGSKIYKVDEVIKGDGGLFLTNSMLYPKVLSDNRPTFLENAPVGDYPLVINLALLGTVYYMDELMSAYRVGVQGSWTEMNVLNTNKKKQHFEEIAKMLNELNQYTNYQYEEVITWTKNRNQHSILLEQRNFKEIKKGDFKEIYKRLGYRRKLITLLIQYCPSLSNFLKSAKRKLAK